MYLYLAVTEEWYGGKGKIKVFTQFSLAEKYKEDLEKQENLDIIILECVNPDPDPSVKICFVVVTEEWYGGEGKVKVFTDLSLAQKYKKELEDVDDLDVLILTREAI